MILSEIKREDRPDIIVMAKAMHAESPSYSKWPFVPRLVSAWIDMCLDVPDWRCIIAREDDGEPVGFMAVGMANMIFSTEKTSDDLSLYVRPEKRGGTAALRLVKEMARWSKERGAVELRLGITTDVDELKTVRFLEKLGFVHAGTLMKLDLTK